MDSNQPRHRDGRFGQTAHAENAIDLPAPTIDRSEAKALLAGIQDAMDALRTADVPKLVALKPDDDNDWRFICPWCGREQSPDTIAAVDVAQRWTSAGECVDTEGWIEFDYGSSDKKFDGAGYVAQCCDLPVGLPEGWDEA